MKTFIFIVTVLYIGFIASLIKAEHETSAKQRLDFTRNFK